MARSSNKPLKTTKQATMTAWLTAAGQGVSPAPAAPDVKSPAPPPPREVVDLCDDASNGLSNFNEADQDNPPAAPSIPGQKRKGPWLTAKWGMETSSGPTAKAPLKRVRREGDDAVIDLGDVSCGDDSRGNSGLIDLSGVSRGGDDSRAVSRGVCGALKTATGPTKQAKPKARALKTVKGPAKQAKPSVRSTSTKPADQRYPELLPFWDVEANGDMCDFTGGVTDLVQWKCTKVPCHRYESCLNRMRANLKARKTNRGCCAVGAGKQICLTDFCNSIWFNRPAFRKFWAPSNGDMTKFPTTSNKVVTWQCDVDSNHTWQRVISDSARIHALRCAECHSVAKDSPDLLVEWDYAANGDADDYPNASHAEVSWICRKDPHHKWDAVVHSRTLAGNGCPICCNQEVCSVDACNSFAKMAPEALLAEWFTERNPPADTVLYGTHEKVWWKCSLAEHEWEAVVASRTGIQACGCPYCKNKSEKCAYEIFEKLFPKYTFTKVRPDFLQRLELDGYCAKLHLAFEYDGAQHEREIKFFHRKDGDFAKQQERDARKNQLCVENDIILIRIPSKYDFKHPHKMEEFIRKKIKEIRPELEKLKGLEKK